MSITFNTNAATEGLNVANGNGYFILSEIFGLEGEDVDCCGEISSATVLLKVALYRTDVSRGTKATTESGGVEITAEGVSSRVRVIHCGRTEEQVTRYLDALEELAATGPEIWWG